MPLQGKEAVLKAFEGKLDTLVRAVALSAANRLIAKTPVDTGRARGNWNVSIDAPDRTHDMEGFDQEGGGTLAKAIGTIAALKAGDVAYITNSVRYVPYLEDGWSKQAPRGMVAVTVAELEEIFPGIVRKVGRE